MLKWYRSGDPRLGELADHTLGLEAQWRTFQVAEGPEPLLLSLGYAISRREYRLLAGPILESHVMRADVSLS